MARLSERLESLQEEAHPDLRLIQADAPRKLRRPPTSRHYLTSADNAEEAECCERKCSFSTMLSQKSCRSGCASGEFKEYFEGKSG